MKSAKDKDTYRRAHESEITLHEAAARALGVARSNGGKLPNLTALQAGHAKLTERKTALNSDYAKLKRQAREIGVIKTNVDSISAHADSTGKAKRGKLNYKNELCNARLLHVMECVLQFTGTL